MSFASVSFLLFFLVVLLLLLLVQRVLPFAEIKRRIICQGILLIASYVFYGWWNMRLCLLLMGITWISFFTAVKKDEKHLRQSRISLLIGVGTPLAVLGIFKYYDFFVTSFCEVFHLTPGVLNLILPVGISFYTFQALSYTIDVYTGKIEKEKSFLQFALYLSFFPQLVAGPIVKASEFLPQLKENRKVTLSGLESGIQIFVFGMFKKVVLADNISVFVDEVYRSPQIFGSGTVALAVAAYAIQIYMDFSGYSDMAIGCAKCMGYELPVNFNLPYISYNVSEFWKRWHISLSSWLMQYLYIPLGGNRKGRIRTYVNLMITMLLGGLWHGAEWSFVLWGWSPWTGSLYPQGLPETGWISERTGEKEKCSGGYLIHPRNGHFCLHLLDILPGRKCAEGMAGIKTVIWLPGGHYTSVQLCHCSNYYSLHCNSGCIS